MRELTTTCPLCGGVGNIVFHNARDVVCQTGVVADYWFCSCCESLFSNRRLVEHSWYDGYYTKSAATARSPVIARARLANGLAKVIPQTLLHHFYQTSIGARLLETTLRYPYLEKKGLVIDIGCGAGDYLVLLRQLGFVELAGTDLYLDHLYENPALQGVSFCHNLKQLDAEAAQLITLYHVLEHVTEPFELLVQASLCLGDAGVLVVQYPNPHCSQLIDFHDCWRGLESPRHLQLPSKNLLREWASKLGMKVGFSASEAATRSVFKKSQKLVATSGRHFPVSVNDRLLHGFATDKDAYITATFTWQGET